MRILVTGSRDWTDEEVIRVALAEYPLNSSLCHGKARGADTLAAKVANELGFEVSGYAAQWDKYGRAAGGIRNQLMLDIFQPDVLLAFPLPQSKGTWDMVSRAKKAGVPVRQFSPLAERTPEV